MNKSIFFILLALICFYLVLDEVYGGKAVTKFTLAIVPSARED